MNRIYTYVSVLSTRKSVQPLKKQTFAIDSVFRLTALGWQIFNAY